MATTSSGIEPHWNYLLALDGDLVQLSRYVEFSSKNFGCFSIELARVLLAAAAEADVVCKQVCKKADPNSSADGINRYRDELRTAFPDIEEFKVLIPRFGLTLCPWENWQDAGGVPAWWTSYNKVKHERHASFERASLRNALNAVAGLFVIVLYLCSEAAAAGELAPPPQLLRVEQKHRGGIGVGGIRGMTLSYKL